MRVSAMGMPYPIIPHSTVTTRRPAVLAALLLGLRRNDVGLFDLVVIAGIALIAVIAIAAGARRPVEFLLVSHFELLPARRPALEVLDCFTQRVAHLRQLPSAEDEEDDDQDDEKFGYSNAAHDDSFAEANMRSPAGQRTIRDT